MGESLSSCPHWRHVRHVDGPFLSKRINREGLLYDHRSWHKKVFISNVAHTTTPIRPLNGKQLNCCLRVTHPTTSRKKSFILAVLFVDKYAAFAVITDGSVAPEMFTKCQRKPHLPMRLSSLCLRSRQGHKFRKCQGIHVSISKLMHKLPHVRWQ